MKSKEQRVQEIKAKRREIAIRYRNGRRPIDHAALILGKRRNEIEDLMRDRHDGLPDTDDRETYLRFWAWHNLRSRHQYDDLLAFGRRNRVELPEGEIKATLRYVHAREHRKFSSTTLGKHLRVTAAERNRLGLTTIEAHTVTKAERKRIRAADKARRRKARRRTQGAQPRHLYEAESLSRLKPWKAMNMSRRTWERHRNKACRKSDPQQLNLRSAGVTLATTAPPQSQAGGNVREGGGLPQEGIDLRVYENLPVELRLACLCLPSDPCQERKAA